MNSTAGFAMALKMSEEGTFGQGGGGGGFGSGANKKKKAAPVTAGNDDDDEMDESIRMAI